MVVIVTGYTLFVTSYMTSYLRLQTNDLAKFVDAICILFYTHSPYLLLYNVTVVFRK